MKLAAAVINMNMLRKLNNVTKLFTNSSVSLSTISDSTRIFKPREESSNDDLPDPETRRRQQVEAAERRIVEQERRGIGNIDAVKRQQQRNAKLNKLEGQTGNIEQQTGLKWQVN